MSNVAVQGDGAVVVTGGNIAVPPTSSDPNFTHVARPSGFGVSSNANAAPAPTAAPPPPGDTQPADARTSAEAQPPPPPAGATTAAAPPASSAPPPAPSQPPPSSAPPPPPPAQPAPAATTAVEAAEAPPPPAAPAATSPPPAEPAPAPAEPTGPAEGQTVIDQFNASTAVNGAAPNPTSVAGANIFAPDVEGEQEGANGADINPAYTVDQTSSSPSASPTEATTSTSAAQPAPTTSSRTTSSSASSTRSSSTTSSHRSSSSASASAEETTETISTTEQPEPSSSANAENASQVTEVATTSAPETSAAEQTSSQADTTFVSGSTTFTGTAALAAAAAAETGSGSKQEKGKDGLSSFAIVGIVGGILVFFILVYVAWFQWRKRRARNDMEKIEDIDGVSPISGGYDPFGLAYEKHSGLDFFDEPLSSRRSQKSRIKSNAPSVMPHNPFMDTAIIANPDPTPAPTAEDEDYERRLETQYTESLFTDPGDAGLGTAKSQGWFVEEDDDRRPSYIDGPQSIYHESNDPDNPNAHPWTEVPLSARSPQSARNPAPPVPPLPAAYQSQKQKRNTRPETDFSYGNFYEGYDDPDSRPVTQHTPSTSALLPWLNRETDAPPPIPVSGPVDLKTLPVHQPKRKDTGFGSPPKMPLRTPPAAAIAGKPEVPNRGWMGVIPSFR